MVNLFQESSFDEICHNGSSQDSLAKWLTPKRKWFAETTERQLMFLPDILKNFPKLIDPKREREQADPWLIAMLIEEMENTGLFGENSNYVLVSNENKNSTVKLPAACEKYNIQCIDMFKFFERNNWKFNIT